MMGKPIQVLLSTSLQDHVLFLAGEGEKRIIMPQKR